MALWSKKYPVNYNQGGDDVYTGFVKVDSEFTEVYDKLNKLRTIQATNVLPVDPELNEIVFDLTDKRLKRWNGTSWENISVDKAVNADNADKIDGFHASQTPVANTIPVADASGKLNLGWLNASQTPTANTIPVADANGKLNAWVDVPSSSSSSETYSRLTVATSFPPAQNHNALCWRSDELKLYRYNAVSGTWSEVDWKTIVKASPEWNAGRLRINSTTGKLEISPDGTNWYECIPAVGSNSIELNTLDNTSFSYKYWIAPGQTAIIRNANHVPIVYTPIVEPFFEGRHWNSYSYGYWIGLRPNNVAINNGDGQYISGLGTSVGANRVTSLSIVPILEQSATPENWGNFVLRIKSNQRWLINSIGQGHVGYVVVACNSSGTASTTSYWLGTWYTDNGTNFTVNVLVLTRTA